mgnify:FL=1
MERRTIGMSIDDPPVDLVALARSYGLTAMGPVLKIEDLAEALAEAFAAAEAGEIVLLDVSVPPPPPAH